MARQTKYSFFGKKHLAVIIIAAVFLFFISYFTAPFFDTFHYEAKSDSIPLEIKPAKKIISHIKTPRPLKAIYMTSWVAGSEKIRQGLVDLIDETEINSVVIDIKDYSGRIAFDVSDNSVLALVGSEENRIPDLVEFVQTLHDKGIYVIGRIAVFQDPYMVAKRPELAVKRESDKALVWKDYKGISWIDPGSTEYWDYIVALGRESYAKGFDELNFDYIRFPSDGNMADIHYPLSEGKVKADVIREFFSYMRRSLGATGAMLSGDLFGMTTTNTDDLNIGQILEDALAYLDYVAPMVYPSHYPPGFNGYKNPAAMPYEVVRYSMDHAYTRSSTTPEKIRPWLQDFNLGAIYTADMVRKQMQAVNDAGFDSWMLWSAANKYTRGALDD